jgi:hypothetical protein
MKVFVIGSGFSASMGLPTLNNIFNEIMMMPERPGESDKENIYSTLEILYPHFRRLKTPSSFPPLEEFLSLIDLAKDLPFIEDGYWKIKKISVLRLLTDYLAKKSLEAEEDELLNSFIKKLGYGDVIITFNWDNLIERCLLKQGKAINFKERDDNAVTLLKLHGSLNWARIPEGTGLKNPDSVTWLHERICHTKDYSYYDFWDVLDEPPFIVLPTITKNPPAESFLKSLWDEAFQSLLIGEQISIIGYSIPEYDLQARTLLVMGLHTNMSGREKYSVIDPNPDISGKYYALINPEIKFIQGKFSEEVLPIIFEGKG